MSDQVRRYEHLVATLFGTPWAITENKLLAMTEVLELRLQGVTFSPEEIQARTGAAEGRADVGRPNVNKDGVAVLPLHGVIAPRANLITRASGGTSTEEFAASFRAALADRKVKAIVLDVDSPGGIMAGVPELADIVFEARGQKPILAAANGEDGAASAAYLIASQADQIFASPSALVGSIGVVTAHVDQSVAEEKAGIKTTIIAAGKFKAAGHPFEPLSDEGKETLQMLVDNQYTLFVEAVARGRGIVAENVSVGFGEGRMIGARAALEVGMIDGIATLEEVIATAGGAPGRRDITAMKAEKDMQATKGARTVEEQEIRTLLGLNDEDNISEAITTLQAKVKASEDAAPSGGAQADELRKELAKRDERLLTLEGEVARGQAERQVEDAITAGKLLPVQRETALKMALRDADEFDEFLKTQPKGLVKLGETGTAGGLVAADGTSVDVSDLEPTPDQVEAAKQLGAWTPEHRIALMRQNADARGIELPADFGKEEKKED